MANEMEWNKFRQNVDSNVLVDAYSEVDEGRRDFLNCMVRNFGQYDDINDVEPYVRSFMKFSN